MSFRCDAATPPYIFETYKHILTQIKRKCNPFSKKIRHFLRFVYSADTAVVAVEIKSVSDGGIVVISGRSVISSSVISCFC